MQKKFYENGLSFECTGCGYCCGHEPGYVFLSAMDLENMCIETGIEQNEFLEKYCFAVNTGFDILYSLKEKENHDCIFYSSEKGCEIYQSRPLQCRTYPFWPSIMDNKKNWEDEAKFCPGMGKGEKISKQLIEEKIAAREKAVLLKKE